VPTDFVIDGRGELQPAMQRHIFAPADAVIESIHVEHSGKVAAGDVLLELRDSELDFKMASILGDLQTQQKRLETVRARRLNFARLNSDDSTEFDDLTSEEERLKTTIASLAEQKEIVSRQLAELSVASNIDGEVLTWGIDEILKSRAVRRGERLLTVADTDGEWRLEMWIADHDVEHVIHARRQTEELAASFVLASRSGTAVHGHVEQIGMATEMTSEGRPGVRVVIAFDRHDVESLRPGTTAFVKIHCGRRAIGYVWFREVLEVVRTRLLF
jgi:multidrug efflux pump subunit AcrA (membrane-fusion protein)